MKHKSVLAVSVAAAVGGVSGPADAAIYSGTLTSDVSFSGNGSSAANLTSSTATWQYNDVTGLLTQTGGILIARFQISPATTLFRHSITALVIGSGGAATAATYLCTEGNFGGTVGASLCGNYNFGGNFVNETTTTWGPGTSIARSVGGDDMAIGPQQSILAYNGFTTTSFNPATTLVLSNKSCASPVAQCTLPSNGGVNAGYTWTLGSLVLLAGTSDDSATAEATVATPINVLANDQGFVDPVTVTITVPPAHGTAVVVGSPGNPAGISVTYTSTAGYTGPDSFTYQAADASLTDTSVVSITVADTMPDVFTFGAQTGVALNTPITSGAVTITGISPAVPVSVAGGQYSVGCTATYTSVAATINNGEDVCVRQTSSATPATDTVTTLTVGGGSGTFTTTTELPDSIPAAFSFAPQTEVALSSPVTSASAAITGINVPAAISVTGGEYAIGAGAFTAAAGTVTNGQTVTVRQTSSATPGTATVATLTVGTVPAPFSVTTATTQPDSLPDQFTFVDQDSVDQDIQIISAPVTITGINATAAISVTGGEYSIGCTGTFTAAAGTISNGQTVCVRHTSASTAGTAVTTILTVGAAGAGNSTSDAFTSGTRRSGGSSAVDGLMLGLLGLLGLARGGRRGRRQA